jgi:hypothetical protein
LDGRSQPVRFYSAAGKHLCQATRFKDRWRGYNQHLGGGTIRASP